MQLWAVNQRMYKDQYSLREVLSRLWSLTTVLNYYQVNWANDTTFICLSTLTSLIWYILICINMYHLIWYLLKTCKVILYMSCERIAKKLFCTVLLCSGLHEAIPDEGVASIQHFFFSALISSKKVLFWRQNCSLLFRYLGSSGIWDESPER